MEDTGKKKEDRTTRAPKNLRFMDIKTSFGTSAYI
jgi:hypothetical protein